MEYTMCYLEVFDEETKQWEYVTSSNEPEKINMFYNNLDEFFETHNLFYLVVAIENEGEQLLFTKYKGLPKTCSQTITNIYHFYFDSVKFCQHVSFIDFNELLTFDYNRLITFEKISKTDLEYLVPDIAIEKKMVITHREWLGEDFFIELYKTKQRFGKYSACRLIYFTHEIDFEPYAT